MPEGPSHTPGRSPPDATQASPAAAAPPPEWPAARFEALLRHGADIVSLLDGQGRLLYNSPAAERISGFTPAELAGVDTFALMHPDDREAVGRAFAEVLSRPGACVTVQYRYRHKSGGWTWMEAVATNKLDDPDLRGVVAISRDITERRRAEEERGRLEAQLVDTQRLESLGVLAGGFAHHFNNLLVGMMGAADLARTELPEGHAAASHLETVLETARRAGALCRELLALADRAEPRQERLALGPLLEAATAFLALSAGRPVEVRRDVPPDLPQLVGDAAQLRQAVVNLLVNAAEAVAGRSGAVTVRARLVDLDRARLDDFRLGRERAPGPYLAVAIEDDGCGMSPEVEARIFTPFFSTKFAGRGLGLPATLRVIDAHGGAIQVRSAPGRGSTFTLLLPVAPPQAPAPAAEGPGAGQGRVLFVDDEEIVRRVGRRMLQRLGYEVEEAEDGVAAVAVVRAAPGRYAAVLLDLSMPRLDGLATLAQLRDLDPGLPVILSSGLAAAEVRQRAEGLGVAAFAEKPYGLAMLREVLGRVIRRTPVA